MTENEKMKPFVINRPKTTKGKIIALLVMISICMGTTPILFFFNKPVLFLGIPLIMFWVIICGLSVMAVLALARKWEVY